jgi:hypothetical protein
VASSILSGEPSIVVTRAYMASPLPPAPIPAGIRELFGRAPRLFLLLLTTASEPPGLRGKRNADRQARACSNFREHPFHALECIGRSTMARASASVSEFVASGTLESWSFWEGGHA